MSRTMRNEKRKERMYKPEDKYANYLPEAVHEDAGFLKNKEHKHNRRVARKQERAAKRGEY